MKKNPALTLVTICGIILTINLIFLGIRFYQITQTTKEIETKKTEEKIIQKKRSTTIEKNVLKLLEKATQAKKKGDLKTAQTNLKKVLLLDPKNKQAQDMLSLLQPKLLQKNQETIKNLEISAQTNLESENYLNAISDFKTILFLDPTRQDIEEKLQKTMKSLESSFSEETPIPTPPIPLKRF